MRERFPFEEIERKTLTVNGVTELDLSNISGNVTIAAGGGRDATIEVTKRGYGESAEEAKRQLAMTDVAMTVLGGGRAEVRTRYQPDERFRSERRNRNFHSDVEYRVTTPAQTRIRVKSISGSIQATKMTGELSLEAVSGDIRIEGGGRVSLAKSVSGDVRITGITGDEPLVVSSVSGTVMLKGLKARYLDVNSVSGDIVVSDAVCDRADLQTISGDVEYSGRLTRTGRYELKAHSGDIRLAPAGDTGFDVEANSFSGKIRSELSIKNEAAEEGLPDAEAARYGVRLPKRATFRGTYKGGGATIELTTFSGDIVIAGRP